MRFEREINIYGDEVILNRFQANETSIEVVQGKISALISESELIELENSQATMYSKLASAIMDIDSLDLQFSELNTKYNTVSGQYTQLDSKLTQVQVSVSGLSANISQVSQNLSNNYSTTTQMQSAINLAVDQFSVSVSQIYATNAGVNEKLSNYPTTIEMQAEIDMNIQQISLAVENGESSSKITLMADGAEIHSEIISMYGLVKFTDLSNSGSTTINGSNIITGKISSENGNVYFDLDNNELACNKMVGKYSQNAYDTVVEIGYRDGTSNTASRMKIYPKQSPDNTIEQYVNMNGVGYIEGPRSRLSLACKDGPSILQLYQESIELRAYSNTNAKHSIIEMKSTASSHSTGGVRISPYLDVGGPLEVQGTFRAVGTKSRLIKTENYGKRLQYCYETSSPLFGDIGSGQTDENGVCLIAFDDIFDETVNSEMEYYVFLQMEGDGKIWIEEKNSMYFTVKGTPNIRFSWEIKVRQKDFEYMRLEDPDAIDEQMIDYDYEANAIEEMIRQMEMEKMLYENFN